jgi:hypothetical protein
MILRNDVARKNRIDICRAEPGEAYAFALIAFGILFIGCAKSNRMPDGALDAQAYDSQVTDNKMMSDGTIVPGEASWRDSNANGVESSVVQDAYTDSPSFLEASIDALSTDSSYADSNIDSDASDKRCGVLRRYDGGIPINGGDGFVKTVFSQGETYGSVNAYNEDGKLIRSIFPDVIVPLSPLSGSDLCKAVAVKDIVAVMEYIGSKGGGVGMRVLVNRNGSIDSFPFMQHGTLAPYKASIQLFDGLYLDKSINLLAIAPDDSVVIGVEPTNKTSENGTIEAVTSEVLGLARLDPSGNVVTSVLHEIESSLEYLAVQLEVDENNRTVILNQRLHSEGDAGTIKYDITSSILLLDPNFEVITTWNAPTDVVVNAFALDGNGNIMLVGSQGVDRPIVWIQKLALPTFSQVWSEARLDSEGQALGLDITTSGDIVVFGWNKAGGTFWLQRYDQAGATILRERIEAALAPNWDIATMQPVVPSQADVAAQTSGLVYISLGDDDYVYCED